MRGPKFTNGVSVPRHTKLPPEVVEAMPYMTGAELKVVIAALEHDNAPIPLADFERITGLTRKSVVSGLRDALERGILQRIPVRTLKGQTTYVYRVLYAPSRRATDVARNNEDATKRGVIFIPPLALKLSIVIESLNPVKQQYLTNGAKRGVKSIPLFAADIADLNNPPLISITLGQLENALVEAGVYASPLHRIRERVLLDNKFAERVLLALALFPLAQELGLADGAGWLVEAISGDWNLEEMAEDYLERARARAEQRSARESLPEDILRGLEKIGYISGFTEVARAFQEDPRRVRGLLMAAEEDGTEHAAARFRQAIRSGAQPSADILYRLNAMSAWEVADA